MKRKKPFTIFCILALFSITQTMSCHPEIESCRKEDLKKINQQNLLSKQENLTKDVETIKNYDFATRGFFPVYTQDPDGRKRVWEVSAVANEKISSILGNCKYKTIEGTNLYEVTSWNDMYNLEKLVNEDHDKMIWHLFNEISHLKSRVGKVEEEISKSFKSKKD